MLSDTLSFLINILFSLLGIVLIVRAWAYAIRLHAFNPWTQAVWRLTDWLVQPIRRLVSPGARFDWPSLLACALAAVLYLLLNWFIVVGRLPPVQHLVPLLVAALLTMARWAFNVILWATLIQAILSWVNPMAPIMPTLRTLTAPLLDPIRRVLPDLGGIDFSPLVLLVLAQVAMMVLQHLAFTLVGV